MPQPSDQITAWIATLSPPDELAVRMAFSQCNPWCRDDKPWQLRVAELQKEYIKTDDDRRRYEERAAKMARDMEHAVQEMKDQAADPSAVPKIVPT